MAEKFNPISKKWWQSAIEKSIEGKNEKTTFASRWVLDRLTAKKDEPNNQEVAEKPEIEAKFVQWLVKVTKDGYQLANLAADGSRLFYSMENGKYGQPLITAEPDKAFAIPSEVSFTNARGKEIERPTEKVSGVICLEDDGTVVHRFSLSNPKAPQFKETADGLIIFTKGEGEETIEEQWYLNVLFDKDGQRIKNHDGYYSRTKPDSVRLIELQDINFVSSSEFVEPTPASWKSLVADKSDLKRLANKVIGFTKKFFTKKETTAKEEAKPDFETKINQWTFRIWQDQRYEIVNLDKDGRQVFYKVISGKYGQPLIIAEPDLAFAAPESEAVNYVKARGEETTQPTERISGIICQEEDGSVAHRFSLSNPKAPKFKVTKDGLVIFGKTEDGKVTKERWYLNVLFDKDGQRIQNHDGYYSRKKPRQVRILELQDLNFFAANKLGLGD